MAEVHTKGIISMCPDSCIVPCVCVCMLGGVCVCVCVWVAQCCLILCYPMNCLWNSLGKNIGVGCHSLLHGIFPIEGSNPSLLYCRQVLYCLSYQQFLLILVYYNLSPCTDLWNFFLSARLDVQFMNHWIKPIRFKNLLSCILSFNTEELWLE